MLIEEYSKSALLVTRLIQMLSLSLVVTGFIWASSDLLLVTVLADSPVTPLSVLFMLYGLMGSVFTEAIARWITKSENKGQKKTRWWSLSLITCLATVLIVTFVGVMVVGKLATVAEAMNLGTSPTTNAVNATMWNTLYSNTYSAFNLTIIIPIVIGAASLLLVFLYCLKKTLPD